MPSGSFLPLVTAHVWALRGLEESGYRSAAQKPAGWLHLHVKGKKKKREENQRSFDVAFSF